MKREKFIQTSKNMVKEYFNRYIAIGDIIKTIRKEDIVVFKFYESPENYRVLLVTPETFGFYYGVTYDKSTDKINSYIYEIDNLRTIGRKEIL